MKQNKKLLLLLLIFTICICNNQHKTAKAAQNNAATILSISNTTSDIPLAANSPVNAEFTITSNETITFMIYTTYKTDMFMQITDSKGQIVCNQSFRHTDNNWQTATANEKIRYFRTLILVQPSPDKYKLSLQFSNDTYYIVNGIQNYTTAPKKVPTLSATNLMLAKGISQKIKVKNTSEKVIWSSTNKSIATVSSSGKIKAKKIGTAIIKAKIADKEPLLCKVTVVKNEYLSPKKTMLDVPVDRTMVDVYKVSYDNKGNIIIKARVLNRYDYRISYIKNFKIQLRTNAGKLIGSYSAKKAKNVNAKSNHIKTCSFKIKKSKLKIKTADLRGIKSPKASGTIYYTRN